MSNHPFIFGDDSPINVIDLPGIPFTSAVCDELLSKTTYIHSHYPACTLGCPFLFDILYTALSKYLVRCCFTMCFIVKQRLHWACWHYGHSGGTQEWLGVGKGVIWAVGYIQQLKTLLASSSETFPWNILFPFIFCSNDIPEKNLITKIVGNSTTAIFRSWK